MTHLLMHPLLPRLATPCSIGELDLYILSHPAGMLFTATIFIVQYSSVSGVLQSATSLLERSKVTRTIPEQGGSRFAVLCTHVPPCSPSPLPSHSLIASNVH